MRTAKYGVSILSSNSPISFALVTSVVCAICYIQLHYNGERLYSEWQIALNHLVEHSGFITSTWTSIHRSRSSNRYRRTWQVHASSWKIYWKTCSGTEQIPHDNDEVLRPSSWWYQTDTFKFIQYMLTLGDVRTQKQIIQRKHIYLFVRHVQCKADTGKHIQHTQVEISISVLF